MNHERNLGVTEAGLGLALLLCLLLILGYMILHNLGGTGSAPAVEVRPGYVAEPKTVPGAATPDGDEQPQVLTIESSDAPAHAIHTSPGDAELR
ncbi:MAG: hypothetical protein WD738_20850 [Pirellulales bacterium]